MRQITTNAACESTVARLSGWQIVDEAWLAVSDALMRNPYGCQTIETDWFALVRFIISEPVGRCPALVWTFVIDEERNVEVVDVEEYEPF